MNRGEENNTLFAIGEKIVCVDVSWQGQDKQGLWKHPVLNQIYTIELVMHDGAVSLKEVDNSHVDRELHKHGINLLAAFWPWHFRKLVDLPREAFLKEEASVFEEQLKEVEV